MKKFTYKNYINCYFNVGSYLADNKAMAISIESEKDGPIATCTVFNDIGFYSENIVTIKNYSENSYMTKFLEKLGIVISILNRVICNPAVYDTFFTENPQTIDTCFIDTGILRQYCKKWNYDV